MKLRDVLLAAFVAAASSVSGGWAQEDVPEVARQKLEQANRHREAGRTEEAIGRYEEAIAAAPTVIEAYLGLGAIYHERQEYEKALRVFQSGLERSPADGTLLFNVAATEARLERFEEALAHADEALASSDSDSAIQTLRGTILRRLGRPEEAVAALRQASELEPKSARAQYNLGNALYELKRKEEALAAFREATRLDEEFQPGYYNLGAVLFDLERFEEALSVYEIALAPVEKDFARGREVPPLHARAYLNLGAIFLKRQSWDRALDAYEKAARLDASLAAAHYNVGFIQYELGRPAEAYQAYSRAAALDPSLPLSYLHMGLIDLAAGRNEAAVRSLEEGLSRFTGEDWKTALLALGPAYEAIGDPARSEERYRDALREEPDAVAALVGLGRLLRQQGKLADARPFLERAGEIVLDGSGVALELAALARAEGDGARERAMYEEALRRDGDRAEMWPVRANLVAALLRTGDVASARAQMQILAKALPAIAASSPEVGRQLRTANALLTALEGELGTARRELDIVLREDPAFVAALNARAVLDAVGGRTAEASRSLNALLSRSSGGTIEALVRANLGQALWLERRPEDAREHLLAAAEAYPRNAWIRTALGEIALGRGDVAGSVRELRAAVETCAADRSDSAETADSGRLTVALPGAVDAQAACVRARRSLGLALVVLADSKMGQPSGRGEALRLVEEAIDLGVDGPVLAQARFVKGTLELMEGQDAKARTDLEKALASGLAERLEPAARNNLGVALYRLGATSEARKEFERARAAAPKVAAALLNLGILHHEAKAPEAALPLYEEYLAAGGPRSEDARKWAEAIRKVYR